MSDQEAAQQHEEAAAEQPASPVPEERPEEQE